MKLLTVSVLIIINCNMVTPGYYDDEDDTSYDEEEYYDDAVSRMRNGTPTDYKKHPYFALITKREDGDPLFHRICGGTLVAPNMVITNGHCVYEDSKVVSLEQVRIRYGMDSRRPTLGTGDDWGVGFDHRVAAIHIHPTYLESSVYVNTPSGSMSLYCSLRRRSSIQVSLQNCQIR